MFYTAVFPAKKCFLLFWTLQIISKFVEKVTVKMFWKLSRIKQQNVNKTKSWTPDRYCFIFFLILLHWSNLNLRKKFDTDPYFLKGNEHYLLILDLVVFFCIRPLYSMQTLHHCYLNTISQKHFCKLGCVYFTVSNNMFALLL